MEGGCASGDGRDTAASAAEVTLRPATLEDESFLYAVYASTRSAELALVEWNEDQKSAFVHMQFAAQQRFYHQQFADAAFQVILCNGVPGGRLYVAHLPAEIRVVDISLLPEFRDRGIGSTLLEQLLAEAAHAGKRVSLHVEPSNPALRLYTRLGFRPVADQGAYLLLEWAPAAGDPT